MKIDFYCGNTPPGGEECGAEWPAETEELDEPEPDGGRGGGVVFHDLCPACGAVAPKPWSWDPDES